MTDNLNRTWRARSPIRSKRGFEVQEQLGAAAHPGGALTPGSGSSRRPGRKGDSVGTLFRQSDKTREKPGAKSMSIKRVWLEEIHAQALATGHQPMLVIGFDPAPPDHPDREDWAAFPLSVASHMTHMADALLRGDIGEARAYARLLKGE